MDVKRFLVVMVVVCGAFMTLGASNADALCSTPYETGWWMNYDANTRGITWTYVEFQCQDVILNGQPYPPGDPYYVSLWGACTPTHCPWGRHGARRVGDWIRTTIDMGYATRDVWVKGYPGYSREWLRVYIYTDFRDPSREDYAMDNWMIRP